MTNSIEKQIQEKATRLKLLKSDLLKELLIRVNWLDFDEEIPSLSYKSVDAYKGDMTEKQYSSFENPIDKWTEKARWDLFKATENLPRELQRHIWETDLSNIDVSITKSDPDLNMLEVWKQTKEAVERYESYELLRRQFFWLTTITDTFFLKKVPLTTVTIPISTISKFEVDKNGIRKLVLDDFSQVINDNKIDIRYVRRCKHSKCQRYFWAGKTNQKCCSSECNNRVNALESSKKLKAKSEDEKVAVNDKRVSDERVRNIHKAKLQRERNK